MEAIVAADREQFELAARADATIIAHLRLGCAGVVPFGREDERRSRISDIVAPVGEHLAALEQAVGAECATEQRLALIARYFGVDGVLRTRIIHDPQRRAVGGKAIEESERMSVATLAEAP